MHIWAWFCDLQSERMLAEGAVQPLTSMQIMAWSEMNLIPLRQWEFRAIRRLDVEYRVHSAKVTKRERDRAKNKPTVGSNVGSTIGFHRG